MRKTSLKYIIPTNAPTASSFIWDRNRSLPLFLPLFLPLLSLCSPSVHAVLRQDWRGFGLFVVWEGRCRMKRGRIVMKNSYAGDYRHNFVAEKTKKITTKKIIYENNIIYILVCGLHANGHVC